MTLEHKNRKLQELIASLKKQSIEQKVGVWKTIALELERPTRHQRAVNLSRIEKYAKDGEVIVVPGKLLGGGEITKKVTVIAHAYSKSTAQKMGKNATIISLEEAMKKYPKGNTLRIMG
ncbi:MAG: 50S ribosomal protein L18e [Candidatus Woesearchaeota archaeon]